MFSKHTLSSYHKKHQSLPSLPADFFASKPLTVMLKNLVTTNIHLQWAVTLAFLLVIRGTRVLSSCPFTRLDKNFL